MILVSKIGAMVKLLNPLLLALLITAILLPKPSFALRVPIADHLLLETEALQTKALPSSGPRYNHLVNEFSEEFPKINGQGITVAVIDAGAVRRTHVEFRKASPLSQIKVLTKKPIDSHSTVVAGIIGAKGQNERASGIAPAASLFSLDWKNDLKQLRSIASRIQISNHSYAPPGGSSFQNMPLGRVGRGDEKLGSAENTQFGKYGPREAEFDNILYGFPSLLAFAAAGNHRDDGLTDRGGLDTLTGLCLSKNAICVGAIENIMQSRPISIEHYSSWGPADDGRIKPDLVATGANVVSTSDKDDGAYVAMSGTAMATAVGSGVAALLMQLYRDTRGGSKRMPTAAEIKAVLIHTATDAGPRGPDPVFGWGSINAQFAGQVIAHKDATGKFLHSIGVGQLTAGATREVSMTATGSRIRVTLVWTDPPGKANTGGLDALPALQNDLDVRLISADGKVYYPYSLDPQRPLSPPLRDEPNRVDNVEVIDVTNSQPSPGWKLQVRARRLNIGPSQSFALVVSGLKLSDK
jgi:subtilisin family serine protease